MHCQSLLFDPFIMNMSRQRRVLCACATLLLLTTLGCGEDGPTRVAVAGLIMVDGQPLPAGTVSFVRQDVPGPNVVATISNGKFTLPRSSGPFAGENTVAVIPFQNLGFAIDDDQAYASAVDGHKRPLSPLPPVPPQFVDESASTVSLETDRLDLRFELVSPPVRRR